jgi:hypothetical protein
VAGEHRNAAPFAEEPLNETSPEEAGAAGYEYS